MPKTWFFFLTRYFASVSKADFPSHVFFLTLVCFIGLHALIQFIHIWRFYLSLWKICYGNLLRFLFQGLYTIHSTIITGCSVFVELCFQHVNFLCQSEIKYNFPWQAVSPLASCVCFYLTFYLRCLKNDHLQVVWLNSLFLVKGLVSEFSYICIISFRILGKSMVMLLGDYPYRQ